MQRTSEHLCYVLAGVEGRVRWDEEGHKRYTMHGRNPDAPCWLIALWKQSPTAAARGGGQRRASPGHGARRRGKDAQEARNADSLGSPGRSSASAQHSWR